MNYKLKGLNKALKDSEFREELIEVLDPIHERIYTDYNNEYGDWDFPSTVKYLTITHSDSREQNSGVFSNEYKDLMRTFYVDVHTVGKDDSVTTITIVGDIIGVRESEINNNLIINGIEETLKRYCREKRLNQILDK